MERHYSHLGYGDISLFMVSDNAVIKEKGQKDGTKKKLGKKETKGKKNK